MITRNAIIIGCPGKGDDYLRGAVKDLENMSNYLTSPRGGAWKKSEIYCLDNPTWAETELFLGQFDADYQFIYFAGHGCSGEDQKRYLTFKDQDIEDLKLLTHHPKQLIVIDACRVYYPTISGIPPAEDVYSYFTGVTDARRIFDNCIMHSPNGKMIIHATQYNKEASEERHGRGGAFTLSLLYTAIEFKSGIELCPFTISYLLPSVHRTLLSQNYSQIPEIAYKEGGLQVPFLIDTDQIVKEEPIQKDEYKRPEVFNISALEGIALFLLLIAVIKGLRN